MPIDITSLKIHLVASIVSDITFPQRKLDLLEIVVEVLRA